MHRKASADTFPCNSKVYLSLLNEPSITLALWQDLAASPVKLRQIDPNRYQGTDGAGTTATWEYVYRSPKLHVLLSDLDYVSPRGAAKLSGRIVLIVHSGFYREVNGEPWIQHDVEAFVKVDSKGWKALAKTVRPLLDKVLEDQVQEAGLVRLADGPAGRDLPDLGLLGRRSSSPRSTRPPAPASATSSSRSRSPTPPTAAPRWSPTTPPMPRPPPPNATDPDRRPPTADRHRPGS